MTIELYDPLSLILTVVLLYAFLYILSCIEYKGKHICKTVRLSRRKENPGKSQASGEELHLISLLHPTSSGVFYGFLLYLCQDR